MNEVELIARLPQCEIVRPRVSADHDRIAWLNARRLGIGSSDCPVVLAPLIADLRTYRSRWELWRDKTGRVPLEDSDEQASNEFLYWGNRMELLTRPEVEIRYNTTVVQVPMLRSVARPWQLASLDGLTTELGITELKNTSEWLSSQWDEQIPDLAELQVQHDMAVTGAEFAIVAGLVGGNKFRHQVIPRSDKLISLINEREEEFWTNNILADVEPEIDGSDGTYRAILASGEPVAEMREAEDPEYIRLLIDDYETARKDEKGAIERKNAARNKLLREMNGAPGLVDDDGNELVRLKGGTYAWKRFETDHPEIADTTRKKVDILDTDAVKIEHPDLAKQYQSKSLHIPKGSN